MCCTAASIAAANPVFESSFRTSKPKLEIADLFDVSTTKTFAGVTDWFLRSARTRSRY